MKFKLCIIFLTVLLLPSVFGLGLTPARTTVNFEPGLQKQVTFSIVNSESKEMNLLVSVQGELAEYVKLDESNVHLLASQDTKEISYSVVLPEDLSPGVHTADIMVLQVPESAESDETYIEATLAVVTQLYVYVPYPGKYAEADLSVFSLDNANVKFVIPVISRGEFDLTSVKAIVDIYTPLNEKIATLDTNEVEIPSGKRKEVFAVWDTSDVQQGPYRAVANLIYDEDTMTLEKGFNVGKKKLVIESVEVNDFSLGEIAKFEVLVRNDWSEIVNGVYVQMLIKNSKDELMENIKSPTYDTPPLEKTLMTAFWDTKGVRVGTYDASLLLNYGGVTDEQEIKLEVNENSIRIIGLGNVVSGRGSIFSENRLLTFLVIGVILLILINIGWFLFLRGKLRR